MLKEFGAEFFFIDLCEWHKESHTFLLGMLEFMSVVPIFLGLI